MSSLVDWQIEAAVGNVGLIFPYNADQLNPASYDVRIGPTILRERGYMLSRKHGKWAKHHLTQSSYTLAPGEFVLASTLEVVNVPDDLEAIFCLKSSRGRDGYDHALAAYIDPGFKGQVTLELHNMNRFHTLEITNGMRIGQLRFSALAEKPAKAYDQTGRYHGDMGPQPSKG